MDGSCMGLPKLMALRASQYSARKFGGHVEFNPLLERNSKRKKHGNRSYKPVPKRSDSLYSQKRRRKVLLVPESKPRVEESSNRSDLMKKKAILGTKLSFQV
ncbi:hypothetical protein GOBAR_DD03997 [Gossypium barbadense]|nr:hypothetical protein GOBAR_DD03997 [Gossypium barbadense]